MPSTSETPGADCQAEGKPRRRILYGRRAGPKLSSSQKRLLAELLPKLTMALPHLGMLPLGTLNPQSLFGGNQRRIALEIGFGGGEHLAYQASKNPDIGYLGVEPYLNGVASLLSHLEQHHGAAAAHCNVRVLQDDARLLLSALAPKTLDRVFVLFPDPWPKKRHHKRRVVNADTVSMIAEALKPGGELRLASDDPGYVRWMLYPLLNEQRLSWIAERPGDWRDRPADWPPTRYEEKAQAAGRAPIFLRFHRV